MLVQHVAQHCWQQQPGSWLHAVPHPRLQLSSIALSKVIQAGSLLALLLLPPHTCRFQLLLWVLPHTSRSCLGCSAGCGCSRSMLL